MGIPKDKRESVKKLVEFLPYLEDLTGEKVCNWETGKDANGNDIATPSYDDKFIEFIDTAFEENILERDYIKIIGEKTEMGAEVESLIYGIGGADYKLTSALLTFLILQEKYAPGIWAASVENKLFSHVIEHLNDLLYSGEN
jgi:hypothetical protein